MKILATAPARTIEIRDLNPRDAKLAGARGIYLVEVNGEPLPLHVDPGPIYAAFQNGTLRVVYAIAEPGDVELEAETMRGAR